MYILLVVLLVCDLRVTDLNCLRLSIQHGIQGCQVGLFEAKFGLFLNSWPRNLLSSWPFFQVYVYLVFGLFFQKFI